MAKVVVTGANGFLGSWLVRELVNQKHDVYALVRESSDLSELKGIPCKYIKGDISDRTTLFIEFDKMDCVFHLAGLIAYKSSDRQKMEIVNVQGTQNVVDACVTLKIPRLVHLSSVVAIGASFSDQQVLDESSEYNIGHLNLGYFETKRQAELIVKRAIKENNLNAVILNPSTIYGAGDARKGSRKTQIKVAKGKFPFYTEGGVNVVAVEDVVDGVISAWKQGKSGERYILSGDNMTIHELFKIIADEAGVAHPRIQMPSFVLHMLGTLGDILEKFGFNLGFSRENAWTATLFHWFDSTKARKELNFKPRPARHAIANSVRWMKNNGVI